MNKQNEKDVNQYFDALSAEYLRSKYMSGRRSYMSERQEKMMGLLREYGGVSRKLVLDAGCGPGVFATCLANEGAEVVAIDFSEEMIRVAVGEVARWSDDLVSFARADIEHLPFKDEAFDLVSTAGVVEYLNGDDVVIGEFHRILKRDGILIISVTNKWSYNLIFDGIVELMLKNDFLFKVIMRIRGVMEMGRMEQKGFKIRKHNPSAFKAILREHKFAIVHSSYFYYQLLPHPFNALISARMDSYLGKVMDVLASTVMRWVGEGYLLACRKQS